MPNNEPSLEDHEARITALEERVKVNTGIIYRNRKNQSRTELVIYGIVGFLVMIVIGLKFEDGSFSFAIPAEIIAAVAVAASVGIKAMIKDDDDKKDGNSNDN